jgi:hypothetical protein
MGFNRRLPRVGRTLSVAGAVGVAVAAVGLCAPAAHATPRPASGQYGVGGTGGASAVDFDGPSGVAVGGGHVWVANRNGNSVTEVNPATGAVVRVLSASAYRFDEPAGVADTDGDLFVANGAGSVTEINATSGRLIRVISGKTHGFSTPVAIKADGGTILVVDHPATGHSALTELSAASGALLHRVTGTRIVKPAAVTPDGAHAWVADDGEVDGRYAVTEVDITTGKVVRNTVGPLASSNPALGILTPDGIANGDGHVWVDNAQSSSITEIHAANGKVRANFDNNSDNNLYGFDDVGAAFDYGDTLYVATPHGESPMVTHVSAVNGVPAWYMCNTNGPYYFSDLTGFAMDNGNLWVTSSDSDNYGGMGSGHGTGSITEMNGTSGALVRTVSDTGVVANP